MTARARFTKADVQRVTSGLLASGIVNAKIEIDQTGKIVIILRDSEQQREDEGEWGDLE